MICVYFMNNYPRPRPYQFLRVFNLSIMGKNLKVPIKNESNCDPYCRLLCIFDYKLLPHPLNSPLNGLN